MSVTLFFKPPVDDDISKIRIYESTDGFVPYSLVEEANTQPYPFYQNYYTYLAGNLNAYYKISFVDNSGNEGDLSNASNYGKPAIFDSHIIGIRYIVQERMRRDRIAMDRNGEHCNLYLRKTYGEKCSCWDDNYKAGDAKCTLCFGVGYKDGYDVALNAKFYINENVERKIMITETGLISETRPEGWIPPDLPIMNGDVIDRYLSRKRYRLADIRPVVNSGIITRYGFKLTELDMNDVVYKIGEI